MRPVASAQVTYEFNVAHDRYTKHESLNGHQHDGRRHHTGRDYAAAMGTRVLATFRGQVKTIGNNEAYGIYVAILTETDGFDSPIEHRYCHLSSTVAKDEAFVNPGQLIGYSGDTGNTTAPHLHYEERVPPFYYADHRSPALDLITLKTLDMSQITESFKREPNTALTLYPNNTKVAQWLLRHEGFYPGSGYDGHVSVRMREGYKAFEKEQGWTPSGVPSHEGMSRLGRRWGASIAT